MTFSFCYYREFKMMKKIFILAVSLVLFFSCSEESGEIIKKDISLFVELNASFDDFNPTRVPLYNEDQISEIDVVVFRRNGDKDYYEKLISIDNLRDVQTPQGMRKGFELTLEGDIISEEVGARLMVFANCREFITDFCSKQNKNTERKSFHTSLKATGYGWIQTKNYPFEKMPLCGLHPTPVTLSPEGYFTTIRLDLFQAFARIDVGVDIGNKTSPTYDKFKIQNVYVFGTNTDFLIPRNYSESIYSQKTTLPNLLTTNTRVVDLRHKYKYEEDEDHAMRKYIYVPESTRLNMSNTYGYTFYDATGSMTNKTNVTPTTEPYDGVFLVLEVKYTGEQNLRYYRVDFQDSNSNYMPIIRNNCYQINIKEVSYAGEDSLDKAMKRVYTTRSSSSVNASGLTVEIKVI